MRVHSSRRSGGEHRNEAMQKIGSFPDLSREKEERLLLVRIAQGVLRLCVGLTLILGILFWADHAADSLVLVYLALLFLVVLSLWTLGVAHAWTKGGSSCLASGAGLFGLIRASSRGREDELLTDSWHSRHPLLLPSLSVGQGTRGEAVAPGAAACQPCLTHRSRQMRNVPVSIASEGWRRARA